MKSSNITLLAVAAVCSGLLMVRCSNTPEEQRDKMNDKMEKIDQKIDEAKADVREEWVEEKNEIAKDLRDLQANIDNKLAKTDEKLASKDLKADERAKHEAMRTELQKEKEVVSAQLASVEGSTSGSWNTVKSDARKAMDDIKAWWDKQEEKIDRETTRDNDGH